MGASTSYIFKRNGNVEKIMNKNLPFGIDEEIDQSEYILDNGDLILMSSDGIFENVIDAEDFEDFIKNIKNYPPQRIVYEILNYTRHTDLISQDDMSIIVLKIKDNGVGIDKKYHKKIYFGKWLGRVHYPYYE